MRSARTIPPLAVDVLIGLAVAGVIAVVLTADQGGRVDPDAAAYLWAAGLGAVMVVRRRYPVLVLIISALGLFAYYSAGYPAVGVAVPMAAASFSAAEFGKQRWALAVGAVVLAVSVFFRLTEGQLFSYVVGYELAGHVALLSAAIVLGDNVRTRRRMAANNERMQALTRERTRQAAEAAAQQSRLELARNLHDTMGHSTSVVSLHAGVAREALLRGESDVALGAIAVIESSARETMSELRRAIGALRTSESEHPPGDRRLSDVPALVAATGGIAFSSRIDVDRRLPDEIETAAFRIVQESVTNIVKHSTATTARVDISLREDRLVIAVADDGTRPPRTGSPAGNGLHGMRERTEALSGRLTAGWTAGGFLVRAELPIGVAP